MGKAGIVKDAEHGQLVSGFRPLAGIWWGKMIRLGYDAFEAAFVVSVPLRGFGGERLVGSLATMPIILLSFPSPCGDLVGKASGHWRDYQHH